MRIVGLETFGVRALADGSWTIHADRNGPGHVTLVTGPPRVGLTALLEAITRAAVLLAGGGYVPGSEDAIRAGGAAATIRTTWCLDPEERTFAGVDDEMQASEVTLQRGGLGSADGDPGLMALMARYDHASTTPKVVSIPAVRSLGGSVSPFSNFLSDQQRKRSWTTPDKFEGLLPALAASATEAGVGRFHETQRLFRALVGSVALESVSPAGELVFRLASGETVTRAQLSLSEQNALVLSAAVVMLGLQRSVILLDTPEMALAPGDAKRWIDTLRAWAPRAQWIIATRDRALVESVESAARLDLARAVR